MYGIKCCKGCEPPKRHVGCHGKCPEYIQEVEEHREVSRNKMAYNEVFSFLKRRKK